MSQVEFHTWHQAANWVMAHVVKIETPDRQGTGFFVEPPPSAPPSSLFIITAYHIVDHAYEWRELIRISHIASGKQYLLDPAARGIKTAPGRDQAIIRFSTDDLQLPAPPLAFQQRDMYYVPGNEVGWLGFPAVASSSLCFFHGFVSAWLQSEEAYLVDGVAINGVSGGPAFVNDKGNITLIGLVTEYHPNLATGTALPGLSLVRSINPLLRYYTAMQEKISKATVQSLPPDQLPGKTPPETK